jgi:hypothetical protein
MDWAEWTWRRDRDARWAQIAAGAESHSRSGVVVGGPVVFEAAHEVEAEVCPVSACRRALAVALGAGWAARITRAVAAVPRTGLLETYALRARRHDERLWACWWNGSFNAAQYWGPGGVEVLGWRTVAKRRGVLDAIEGIRLSGNVMGHLVEAG